MKRNLFFVACWLLTTLGLSAQTGTIRGKVLEDDSSFEVIGANVALSGAAGTGTVTDIDGQFSLKVPAGTHSLTISYLGFDDKLVEGIVVTEGNVTVIDDVRMGEAAIEITGEDGIVLTITAKALRNTENAMQALERKSINTVNAISSQAFSLRGDSDAAAAVKRVPGVSVEGGKYVYVRGLGDRYSKTTLNGANVPGLDPDKNTVQMDLFPTALIDNIVVYKNFTPDLPGDFTGGLIDITTKDFPEQLLLRGSVSTGFNANANLNDNFLTYQGSGTDWLGYDNGFRDFPAGFDNVPTNTDVLVDPAAADRLTEATLALNNVLEPVREAQPLNHSLGISAGNQYQVGGASVGIIGSFNYRRNFSGYNDGTTARWGRPSAGDLLQIQRRLVDRRFSDNVMLGGMLNTSVKLNPYNKVSLNLLRNQAGQQDTRFQDGTVVSLRPDALYQERTLAYQERTLSSAQLRGEHAFGATQEIKVDWSTAFAESRMEQPDLRFVNNFFLPNSNTFLVDPAEDIPPTRFSRSMRENSWDNRLDLTYELKQWNGLDAKIKAGGAYLLKQREFDEQTLRYTANGDASDFTQYVTPENVWTKPENTGGVFIQDLSNAANRYDSDINVTAGYLMTELPLTARLTTILGARVENTNLNFTSYSRVRPLNNVPLLDRTNLLPSANLIYQLQPDKMNLRAGYSQTVARPTFREIAPVAIFDEVRNLLVLGNPALEITTISNYDLRWEYFYQPGEMVSVSAFYKDFADPIELTLNDKAGNDEFQYRNVAGARVYGIEFEARKKLVFGNFQGLSAGTNVTLVTSEVDIPTEELENLRKLDPKAEATRPLFGQSPYLVNGYLQYLGSGGTNANLSFNVQGERLFLVARGILPDVYEKPFPSLNLKVSQRFGRLVASAGVNNLLDATFERSQELGGETYLFRQFNPGRTIRLGVNYNFIKE